MADRIFQKKRNMVWVALLYTFLWGSAFPLVKLCMDGFGINDNMGKCLVAGLRFTASGVGLCLWGGIRRKGRAPLPRVKEMLWIAGYGVARDGTTVFVYLYRSFTSGWCKGRCF